MTVNALQNSLRLKISIIIQGFIAADDSLTQWQNCQRVKVVLENFPVKLNCGCIIGPNLLQSHNGGAPKVLPLGKFLRRTEFHLHSKVTTSDVYH
jgi:hypothetical protein